MTLTSVARCGIGVHLFQIWNSWTDFCLRFAEDDLDGDNVEFEPQDENLKKIDPRMGTPQSVYKVKFQGWEHRSLSTR